ncbi:MAG TPA: RHS repeat-associated core domain-containing protein [Phycisphaerales bacterium]|nr:RHS repeat-associated core domain-containing protein [Phycisphaerales bacterium]
MKRQTWLDGAVTTGSGSLPNKPPIYETTHTYDRASNRLSAYDARPGAKIAFRDWQHLYDGLDRLTESKRGAWNGTSLVVSTSSQQWALDMLGNWTELRTDLNGNGVYTNTGEVETRQHNKANETEWRDQDATGTTHPQLPFTYDDAGNMRQQDRTANTRSVYTHDAWNRLVKVTIDQITPAASVTLQESEYNGLHWRTVRKLDTTTPANGLDEKRQMYYSAAWQMVQEEIDTDYVNNPGTNNRAQQVWGVRYIDDAVCRRLDSGANGSYENTYHYLTDVQFSVAAVVASNARLSERVRYTPYGVARHSWFDDSDGDGDTDAADKALIVTANIGTTNYNVDADFNRDGAVNATDLAMWVGKAALAAGDISDPAGPGSAIGYCGYLFNREIQIYKVRFRDYDPALGRWLERDPAGYVDGPNLFQYVGSRPVSRKDPLGLGPTDEQMNMRQWAREQRDDCAVCLPVDEEGFLVMDAAEAAALGIGEELLLAGELRRQYDEEVKREMERLPKVLSPEALEARRCAIQAKYRRKLQGLFRASTKKIQDARRRAGHQRGFNPAKTSPGVNRLGRVVRAGGTSLVCVSVGADVIEVVRAAPEDRLDVACKASCSTGAGFLGGLGVGAAGGALLGPPGAVIGGAVGGIAGCFGADWLFDWLYEDDSEN